MLFQLKLICQIETILCHFGWFRKSSAIAFCAVNSSILYSTVQTYAPLCTHIHRLNLKIQSYSSIKRHSPCLPSANEQPNIEMLYEHIVHLLLFAVVRKKNLNCNTQFCIYIYARARAFENNNKKMHKQQWHLLRICRCTRSGGEICKSILILIQTRTNFIILFVFLLFRPFVGSHCVCARACGYDLFFSSSFCSLHIGLSHSACMWHSNVM